MTVYARGILMLTITAQYMRRWGFFIHLAPQMQNDVETRGAAERESDEVSGEGRRREARDGVILMILKI